MIVYSIEHQVLEIFIFIRVHAVVYLLGLFSWSRKFIMMHFNEWFAVKYSRLKVYHLCSCIVIPFHLIDFHCPPHGQSPHKKQMQKVHADVSRDTKFLSSSNCDGRAVRLLSVCLFVSLEAEMLLQYAENSFGAVYLPS